MKAPAELILGLPAYSLPSVIEGEFHNVASRAAFLDGRLSEVNRLVTSLTQSVGNQNLAVHSRMSAVEESAVDWRFELDALHTQSANQLDRIAELESQLEEQDSLIQQMNVLQQQLSVSFKTHLKDFQHFIAEHFLPIQRHVALNACCSCFNNSDFFQSPIDDDLFLLLNTIIQRGIGSQYQDPVPIPNPSTRCSRVEAFTPARPRSPPPSTFRCIFICTPSSTNPPSPNTDQSIRSPSLPTPFFSANEGSSSDMLSLESNKGSSDGDMVGTSGSGEEIREGFSRSGIRAGSL